MTKTDICMNETTKGYWSALGGVEVKDFAYGVEDYCYCVSGAWIGKRTCHKVKIRYSEKGPYIVLHGCRLYFNECIAS